MKMSLHYCYLKLINNSLSLNKENQDRDGVCIFSNYGKAEKDMENSADQGGRYPQRPKPESAEFFISYES